MNRFFYHSSKKIPFSINFGIFNKGQKLKRVVGRMLAAEEKYLLHRVNVSR